MTPEIRHLLSILGQAYDRRSWHGTNLRGSLRTLSPRQIAWRPGRGRHNIWELVVHCAYWKYAARRRIAGEPRGSFPLDGSNWFKRPHTITNDSAERDWRADVSLLDSQHRSLVAAVAALPPGRLNRPIPNSRESCFTLITGAAAHDLYHAGQIQLLKRLAGSTKRSG